MRTKATLPPFPGWDEVPPMDLPLNGARPRDHDEICAVILDYTSRQPVLRDWIEARVAAYSRCAFMWPAGAIEYAAARDAACWQLGRPAFRVAELLAGIEDPCNRPGALKVSSPSK